MSRLIVKNLPHYVSEVRLKEIFTQKGGPGGTLTDVKIARKQDGTSRRFGFLGFKTEKEARKAQEWFDRSYIDTTRISVQVVEQGAKDAPLARPSKRPRLESSVKEASSSTSGNEADGKSSVENASKDDAEKKKYEEFMEVMRPRTKKGPSWANDDTTAHLDHRIATKAGELSEQGNSLRDPKADGRPVADRPNVDVSATNDDLDDAEWMKRRITSNLLPDEEKTFEQDEDDVGDDMGKVTDETAKAPEIPAQSSDEVDSARNTILQTSRLFLRNLPFTAKESDLEELFAKFGEIAQVHITLDPVTKISKGLAFVKFVKSTAALEAFETLDKTSFQGRLLHILAAVDRKVVGDNVQASKVTVKGDREKKRKENAAREFNWSMLYMNSDAVASSIADRMNIKKSDIVNPEDESDKTSPAVKLALAETHTIQETKTYLESEGIDLSAFASLAAESPSFRRTRSDTCILVKNIPYGTTLQQIRDMFEQHGQLHRVLLPPAGTLAVVEFIHADEASRAFKAIAYRRIGSSIIYLERAPIGLFKPEGGGSGSTKTSNNIAVKPITIAENDLDEADESVSPGSTLFVKNLSFSTTSERLSQVFRHLPEFAFARIQTKPDPKGPSLPRLSMGYGFVGFKSPSAAKKAILSIQNFVLDGHSLHVNFAGRGTEEDEIKGKEKISARTTKMIVKNVPFEASKKDIRDLFGAHGQLKSVRLPKRFDSRSRGFAFLDFVSRREAENAYTALKHTHLLGRHLVLQWAEEEPDIEMLRQKAGLGYGGGAELPGRKRKLDLGGNDDEEEADS